MPSNFVIDGKNKTMFSNQIFLCIYVGQGFHQVWYQGGVKATVSGVVEDLKFKISEGADPNWLQLSEI